MNLESQFKVIFFSFIYGMFFVSTYKAFVIFKIRKWFNKFILSLLFCLFHLFLFYFLLYKIDNGVLNMYVFIFLFLGGMFCKLLYFKDKNR